MSGRLSIVKSWHKGVNSFIGMIRFFSMEVSSLKLNKIFLK